MVKPPSIMASAASHSTAPLRALLAERNALSDRLNEGAWTDEAAAVVCTNIDRLEVAIINRAAATPEDAIVKLVALAQIAASEREIEDWEAINVIADAQRQFGLGWLDPAHASFVDTIPLPLRDGAILSAFTARRREFEQTYDTDMTQEEENSYFFRVEAYEAVIHNTPAKTIAGVIAKLRIAFMHQEGSAWSDRAIMDPAHSDFIAGLAEADLFTQMQWAAIENLATLAGIDLAAQGR